DGRSRPPHPTRAEEGTVPVGVHGRRSNRTHAHSLRTVGRSSVAGTRASVENQAARPRAGRGRSEREQTAKLVRPYGERTVRVSSSNAGQARWPAMLDNAA